MEQSKIEQYAIAYLKEQISRLEDRVLYHGFEEHDGGFNPPNDDRSSLDYIEAVYLAFVNTNKAIDEKLDAEREEEKRKNTDSLTLKGY